MIIRITLGRWSPIYKSITYQGCEYIVTHEFENQIWAFREVKHDIIDVYRCCMGHVTVDRMLVPVLQQVFAHREFLQEQQDTKSVEKGMAV